MSSASARVGATHMAMSSPTCRALPVASGGCSETLKPGNPDTARIALTPSRSAAVNTRSRTGFGNIDAADAGVRERAADKSHILHAGQANVADILPQAPHQALVLLAGQPRADALGRFGFRCLRQSVTSSIRRCAARTSAPFGRLQLLENGEVIRAGDRQQRARRMSCGAQRRGAHGNHERAREVRGSRRRWRAVLASAAAAKGRASRSPRR